MNVSASNQPSVKRVSLADMTVPESVQPGETFSVSLTVANSAPRRQDEDACGDPSNPCGPPDNVFRVSGPTCVAVSVTGGGQTATAGPKCVPGAESGSTVEQLSTTLRAPEQPGEMEVSSELFLPGSQRRSQAISESITVTGVQSQQGAGEPRSVGLDTGQLTILVVVLVLIILVLLVGQTTKPADQQ